MMGQESLESAIVLASLSVNKSSTAMLAQANMVSQNILQLLGN
jgi:flagellin-like hook-associated protein FlgL